MLIKEVNSFTNKVSSVLNTWITSRMQDYIDSLIRYLVELDIHADEVRSEGKVPLLIYVDDLSYSMLSAARGVTVTTPSGLKVLPLDELRRPDVRIKYAY